MVYEARVFHDVPQPAININDPHRSPEYTCAKGEMRIWVLLVSQFEARWLGDGGSSKRERLFLSR
jgi:hypothetical protein